MNLESGGRGRDLGKDTDIVQKDEPPPRHLSPIAQVQILCQRVERPAPRRVNAFTSPHAGRAIEVEEATALMATALLKEEVAVEKETLAPGQPALIRVQVVPASLHHADARVLERGKELSDQVRGGYKVSVENE